MIKKYSDLEINEETLQLALKTANSQTSWERKVNSPKFLIIDWTDAPVELVDFKSLDKDLIQEYFLGDLTYINHPALLLAAFLQVETENEEYLWNRLVDNRVISDELYQLNTYGENFAILMKVTPFKIK